MIRRIEEAWFEGGYFWAQSHKECTVPILGLSLEGLGLERDRTVEKVGVHLDQGRGDRDGGGIGDEVAEQRSASAAAAFELAVTRERGTGARYNGRPGDRSVGEAEEARTQRVSAEGDRK
jgi:hypothetical protein